MRGAGCSILIAALGATGCGGGEGDADGAAGAGGIAGAGATAGAGGAGGGGGTGGAAGAGASAGVTGTGGSAGAGATGGAAGTGASAGMTGTGGASGAGGAGGAGGMAGASSIRAIHAIPEALEALDGDTFFDHPWPSDFRKETDGTVRFTGYPNPNGVALVDSYLLSMVGALDGFSPAAAGFLRFDGALDPTSLPAAPDDTLDPNASVQLVDVDPGSLERGTRRLLSLHWRRDEGVYWEANTLAFMPAFGFPLRAATRYALVVTDVVAGEAGEAVVQSTEIRQALGLDPATGAAAALRDAVAPAVSELDAAGIPAEAIVHLAVFTTNDPIAKTVTIRDWVMTEYPAPTVTGWQAAEQAAGVMDVYEGQYGPSPDFQRGTLPFAAFGDGGSLSFDAAGVPTVEREFDGRFVLVVPDDTACPEPATGHPVVVYAHGTNGDYRSFIRNGTARALATRCLAGLGVDQIFHGTRPGSPNPPNPNLQQVLLFNVLNPEAARANGPQSAIDVVQQARLFTETAITVPATVSRTGADIAFDPNLVSFFGHSQGGLSGPMFLAVDDQARGGVLSGSGSYLTITLLEKTAPIDIPALLQGILQLSGPDAAELNDFHPMLSMAQTVVDSTDPAHYVPSIVRAPRGTFAAKSILMTEGVNPDFTGDTYTPPRGIEAQAIALGLPPQEPVIHPPPGLAWSGLTPVMIPSGGLSGNLAGGTASGVLAQWPATAASDGHFVVFDIAAAQDQAAGFLRNLADDPIGRVPAP